MASRNIIPTLEKQGVEIDIIDNYCNDPIDEMDSSSADDKYPETGIFELELDDNISKEIVIKGIIDKSSILDNIDEDSHYYQVLDSKQK